MNSAKQPNLYRRVEEYLERGQEGAGPIPGTLSLPRMGMIWLAANFVVTTLLTGTLFIPGVKFGTAFAMILVGTLIGTISLTLVGNIGTRTGLPTMAASRGAFGLRGSYLPVAANVIILMGWSWVQAMLAGVTVDHVVADFTGFSNPILFSVICQTLVVIFAVFGHEGIARLEPWIAVLILAVIIFIFFKAFGAFSLSEYQSIPVDRSLELNGIVVLDIVVATAISWTVLSADINRLARNSIAGIVGSGLGYTASTVISMTLGLTALGYVILSGDSAVEFDPGVIVDHFGVPLAIVIFFSVMATNTMVVYGMTNSVINARPRLRLKFLPTALILGVISIIGSTWLGLLDRFTDFLSTIGSLFVPIFAIMIIDYYFIKGRAYTPDILRDRGGEYWYQGGINWSGICVWAIGTALSYVLTYLWFTPVGAIIPTFLVTAALYFVVSAHTRSRYEGDSSKHLSEMVQDAKMEEPPEAKVGAP